MIFTGRKKEADPQETMKTWWMGYVSMCFYNAFHLRDFTLNFFINISKDFLNYTNPRIMGTVFSVFLALVVKKSAVFLSRECVTAVLGGLVKSGMRMDGYCEARGLWEESVKRAD